MVLIAIFIVVIPLGQGYSGQGLKATRRRARLVDVLISALLNQLLHYRTSAARRADPMIASKIHSYSIGHQLRTAQPNESRNQIGIREDDDEGAH